MQCTIKWWRNEEKPAGIEYRSLLSEEIEPIIRELMDIARVRRIEIHNEPGHLLAHYPDAKIHRPRNH